MPSLDWASHPLGHIQRTKVTSCPCGTFIIINQQRMRLYPHSPSFVLCVCVCVYLAWLPTCARVSCNFVSPAKNSRCSAPLQAHSRVLSLSLSLPLSFLFSSHKITPTAQAGGKKKGKCSQCFKGRSNPTLKKQNIHVARLDAGFCNAGQLRFHPMQSHSTDKEQCWSNLPPKR